MITENSSVIIEIHKLVINNICMKITYPKLAKTLYFGAKIDHKKYIDIIEVQIWKNRQSKSRASISKWGCPRHKLPLSMNILFNLYIIFFYFLSKGRTERWCVSKDLLVGVVSLWQKQNVYRFHLELPKVTTLKIRAAKQRRLAFVFWPFVSIKKH